MVKNMIISPHLEPLRWAVNPVPRVEHYHVFDQLEPFFALPGKGEVGRFYFPSSFPRLSHSGFSPGKTRPPRGEKQRAKNRSRQAFLSRTKILLSKRAPAERRKILACGTRKISPTEAPSWPPKFRKKNEVAPGPTLVILRRSKFPTKIPTSNQA